MLQTCQALSLVTTIPNQKTWRSGKYADFQTTTESYWYARTITHRCQYIP